MANPPISQRISLEGAAEIRKSLTEIGTAVKQVVEQVNGMEKAAGGFDKAGNSVSTLSTRIQAAREHFGRAGEQLDIVGAKAILVGKNIALVGAAAVGTVVAFGAFLSKLGDAQEALQNTADTLGLTVQKFDELSKVAELNGISSGAFEKGLLKLNAAMQSANKTKDNYEDGLKKLRREFARGNIDQAGFQKGLQSLRDTFNDADNSFRKLGVAIRDENGELRNVDDVFFDVGNALKDVDNAAERTGLSMDLFGSKNAKLATFAASGADAIRKQQAEVRRLMPTLDEASRGALDRAGDAFTVIGKAAQSTTNMVAAAFAPLAERTFKEIAEAVARARGPIVAFAQDIANRAAPVVGSFIALLQGRDQDAMPWMVEAKNRVEAFGVALKQVYYGILLPAFNAVLQAADNVAAALNAVFGTNFTGGALLATAVLLKFLGVFSLLSSVVGAVSAVFAGLSALLGGPFLAVFALVIAAVVLFGTNWTTIVTAAQGLWQGFTDFLSSAWNGATSAIKVGIDSLTGWFKGLYDSVIGWFGDMINKAIELGKRLLGIKSATGSSSGGDSTPAFAGGGEVKGPGSGTSDSILARLSNGEFVIRAQRVRELGLGFLNRLNGSAGSFGDIIRGMGAVPSVTRGYASGGLVSSAGGGGDMRPFVLQLGDASFGGMRASQTTIDSLMKYSTAKNLRSGGRAPSWVGGR